MGAKIRVRSGTVAADARNAPSRSPRLLGTVGLQVQSGSGYSGAKPWRKREVTNMNRQINGKRNSGPTIPSQLLRLPKFATGCP